MTSIRVLPFCAVRGHFDYLEPWVLGFCDDTDGAVLVLVKSIFEKCLDFLRRRIRCDVPILRLAAEDQVAYASAHKVRLKSGGMQRVRNRPYLLKDCELRLFHFGIVTHKCVGAPARIRTYNTTSEASRDIRFTTGASTH